jgi:hypothetical protein
VRAVRQLDDRELELERPGIDIQRQQARRWPAVRPVGSGHGQPQGVARFECPRGRLELDLDIDPFVRSDRGGSSADLAARVGRPAADMAKVEHAASDQCRVSLRQHVTQLDADVPVVLIAADAQPDAPDAHELGSLRDRPVVHERAGVVGALIERLPPRQAAAAGVPRSGADVALDDK